MYITKKKLGKRKLPFSSPIYLGKIDETLLQLFLIYFDVVVFVCFLPTCMFSFHDTVQSNLPKCQVYVPVNSKTAHAPPTPGQTLGHLTFWKNFGQISRYVASLDGQMPHPLELQRGSIPHPPVMLKQLWKQVVQNFQPL